MQIGCTIRVYLCRKKEMKVSGFVARDKDNTLHLFRTIPIRSYDGEPEDYLFQDLNHWSEHGTYRDGLTLPYHLFPELTWDDDAVEVEFTIEIRKW